MKLAVINIFIVICVSALVQADISTLSSSNQNTISFSRSDSRGEDAAIREFPWIVALMKNKVQPASYLCGGVLISTKFVLSAAQCFDPKESDKSKQLNEILQPTDIVAIFGAHDLSKPYEIGKNAFAPKKIIIHDDWKQNTTNFDADLALLEFIEIPTKLAQPVALWASLSDPPMLKNEGTVVGWTKSESSTIGSTSVPKKLTVPIQTNEDCFLTTKTLLHLSSRRTFCAGFRNFSNIPVDARGVCRGDRGSGLVIHIGGISYLKGIMSATLDEAETSCDVSRNAVYANVFKFRNWIQENILEPKAVSCATKFFSFGKSTECAVKQQINSEAFVFGPEADMNILSFKIHKRSDVSFLPRNIGKKFPNLEQINVTYSNLTIVRDFYFKDLKKVRSVTLSYNNIAVIEAGAFNDLISVTELLLKRNKLRTLDGRLFATMVNLEYLYLTRNKIKFLVPNVFKITEGKLKLVDLGSNECINRLFHVNQLSQLEGQLLRNCNQRI